jgi:ADP-dependent NAD(P)H-hydrate dehydratase / NAD(P)H-hydrate epimerase
MKVLTAAQMREIDRRTQELGIPGLILMENAGHRVVEFLEEAFAPLASHRIAVLCGKGNNGGDGLVVARQLFTRVRPQALDVLVAADPAAMRGDAAANYRMLQACGCPVVNEITPRMRTATLVVDALLGTGLNGAASGRMLELIREINTGFPLAKVVAVDLPSGLASDSGQPLGESARADFTVTFTAPKVAQVLRPNCERIGSLRVAAIGSPPELYEQDDAIFLSLSEPRDFARLFGPREAGSHKGAFGHVLVVGGSRGKTGAAAMAGMAALRAGAGLVTVASAEFALPVIASHAAELMTEPLPENEAGGISLCAIESGRLAALAADKDVVAVGPGLGTHPETIDVVRRLAEEITVPLIVDADGLNALAGTPFHGQELILTPHPGEMARLSGRSVAEIQTDRVGAARALAREHQATVVLKGQRTVIAFPDSKTSINPTGTPAMATGGTGDILTGLIAGLVAQFPGARRDAVAAAVWLHGRAGELGSAKLGEKALVATDLLRFLPEAMDELANLSHRI